MAIPIPPVIYTGTQIELLSELLKAWHIRLSGQDFSTLLHLQLCLDECATATVSNNQSNYLYGVELGSFLLKDGFFQCKNRMARDALIRDSWT